MYRPGWRSRLSLAADGYGDGDAGPAEGPRSITRGRWPEEPVATRRLGGSAEFLLDRGPIVRLLLQASLGRIPKDTVPSKFLRPGSQCQFARRVLQERERDRRKVI